jgi:hypothetical protein
MTLVQQTVGNTAYYTDGVNYYTFHVVSSPSDALWIFACMDLGITKRSGFSTDETASTIWQEPVRNRKRSIFC